MRFAIRGLRASAVAFVVLLMVAFTGIVLVTPASAEPDSSAEVGPGRTILVLDSSGSMSGAAGGGKTKIDAAKSALRTVVKGLPDDAEVGLRVFGAKVYSRNDPGSCQDSQVVVAPGVDNRDAMLSEIDKYKPYGETPIPHALREAAKDLGSEGTRSIVLVSDGESTCDPNPCVVAKQLAKDGIDLRIDVVGLSVSGKARNQLECIAEEGNGSYYDADDAGDIESTLTRVAKRAAQPFTLDGAPISGGTESNPTPVTVGNWVDAVGSDTKYYAFERTEAGTTLRVAAVSQGGTGTNDVVSVEVLDADGRRCDLGYITRILDNRSLIGAQATADEASGCDQPGTYTIKVSRGTRAEAEAAFGLSITEEPRVTDPGFVGTEDAEVKAVAPSFQGTAQEVAGSASFTAAPELTTGLWSSDVVPGEALVYRFRLDHGQSANLGLRFEAGSAGPRGVSAASPPMARMTLHNPLLANLGFPDAAVFSERVGADETVMQTATPQVSKVTGKGGGDFDGGADFTAAGDYYLMVAVGRGENLELPFEIDLQIEGEPAAGPTYADGAAWTIEDGATGGEPEPSDVADEPGDNSDGQAKAADDDSSDLRLAAGVVAGLVGLGVVAAAVLLLRRRRTPQS